MNYMYIHAGPLSVFRGNMNTMQHSSRYCMKQCKDGITTGCRFQQYHAKIVRLSIVNVHLNYLPSGCSTCLQLLHIAI